MNIYTQHFHTCNKMKYYDIVLKSDHVSKQKKSLKKIGTNVFKYKY